MNSIIPVYSNQTNYIHDNTCSYFKNIVIAKKIINTFSVPNDIFTSNPDFNVSSTHITVIIGYYSRISSQSLTNTSIIGLQKNLEKFFDRPVQIRIIKLSGPYLDATILAKFISHGIIKHKFSKFIRRQVSGLLALVDINKSNKSSYNNQYIPSLLAGIKVRLSGRLTTEKTLPRKTVQIFQVGTMSNSPQTHISLGSCSAFNRKGTYTVKVWLCNYTQ